MITPFQNRVDSTTEFASENKSTISLFVLKKTYLFLSALLMDIIVLLDFLPQSCQGGSSLYQQMCNAKTFRHTTTERERTCIIKHGTNMLENKIYEL